MSPGTYPHSLFVGNVTFEMAHVGAYVMGEDANPNYDGDVFLKNLITDEVSVCVALLR